MIRRIFLPLECGDDRTRAVTLARDLAARAAIDVILVRVDEWPVFGAASGHAWFPKARTSRLTAVRRSLEHDRPGGVRVLSPQSLSPAVLAEEADRSSASLILLPHRREGFWNRLFMGRGLWKMLRNSRIPILAVPELPGLSPVDIRRVLLALPEGEAAPRSTRMAIALAQLWDASVDLLRVRRGPTAPSLSEWFWGPHPNSARRSPAGGDPLLVFERRGVPAQTLSGVAQSIKHLCSRIEDPSRALVLLADVAGGNPGAAAIARTLLRSQEAPVLLCRETAGEKSEGDVPLFRVRF